MAIRESGVGYIKKYVKIGLKQEFITFKCICEIHDKGFQRKLSSNIFTEKLKSSTTSYIVAPPPPALSHHHRRHCHTTQNLCHPISYAVLFTKSQKHQKYHRKSNKKHSEICSGEEKEADSSQGTPSNN